MRPVKYVRSCESHYLAKLSWLPSQKKVSVRLPTDSMSLVGVEELKKEQSQAIRSFVSGRDVFVALPTGCGKWFILTEGGDRPGKAHAYPGLQ